MDFHLVELAGIVVEERVGSGRHGDVWRGRTGDGALVAVKVWRDADPALRAKLRRDAAIVSSVGGEHVLRVHDVVLHDGRLAVVSDWADGGSLAAVVAARPMLAAPEVVTLVGPLAGALGEVHRQGIVHGDIGIGAVLFAADGRPLLGDFGVVPGGSATDDVGALCDLGLRLLDVSSAPAALVDALESGRAADPLDRPDAGELAMAVLTACAAAPIRLPVTPAVAPERATPGEPPAAETRHGAGVAPAGHDETAPRRRRPLAVAAVAAALLALAVVVGHTWGRHAATTAASLPPLQQAAEAPATPDWMALIRTADAVRREALATRDPARLADVESGQVLAGDRALIQQLTAAALWLHGWQTTPVLVVPLAVDADRAELRVTDSRSSYELVAADGTVAERVPARAPTPLRCVVVRTPAGWRLAEVVR